MALDHEAADLKRTALVRLAKSAQAIEPQFDEGAATSVVTAFAKVSPPEDEPGELALITVSSLYNPTAYSQKPGNILLNWRKLVDVIPDVALAGLGATTLPVPPGWSFALAGLYVWNKVYRGATEEFTSSEATTILALWKHRDGKNQIAEDVGFDKTNELRVAYQLPPLSHSEFAAAINRLSAIGSIELDSGVIWLREWVRIRYSR